MIKIPRHEPRIRRFEIVEVTDEGQIFVTEMPGSRRGLRDTTPSRPRSLDEVMEEGKQYYITEDLTRVLEISVPPAEQRA